MLARFFSGTTSFAALLDESPSTFPKILGVRRGDLGLDADGLAVLVDALDLMLRKRLANGNGRGQPQIDEHFGARRIVVQTVGDPLVELADRADDALQEVLRAHG